MGSYLSGIASGNEIKSSCPLINLSLAKIRELHGGFKSICDNFAINLTEFESIFSSNQAVFAIFDTDNNGRFFAQFLIGNRADRCAGDILGHHHLFGLEG